MNRNGLEGANRNSGAYSGPFIECTPDIFVPRYLCNESMNRPLKRLDGANQNSEIRTGFKGPVPGHVINSLMISDNGRIQAAWLAMVPDASYASSTLRTHRCRQAVSALTPRGYPAL